MASSDLDLERGLSTTKEDIAALRRIRYAGKLSLAEALEQLARPGLFSSPPRRSTSEGWIPFSLE